MSYFFGTFPKKFCGSDDHRPSNKPEPLHNDFWDTRLYLPKVEEFVEGNVESISGCSRQK